MTKEISDATEEVEQMEKTKDEKWALYNELKEKEAQLTQDRENRLKDVEARVKEAKELVVSKENAAREVSNLSNMMSLSTPHSPSSNMYYIYTYRPRSSLKNSTSK